jgi:hypothetical protein
MIDATESVVDPSGARLGRARSQTDRPALVALIVLAGTSIFTLIRFLTAGHGDLSRFVLAERTYVDPSRAPHGLAILPSGGYDGQFYYRLALDPFNLHHTAFGISLDTPFRLQRIGYPFLAWIASLNHHGWVPFALVLINVLAMTSIGLVGGMIARDSGRHALWGLLLAGYFGFVFSVARDTAEPVAAAFLLGGVLAYRRRRPMLAGLLLACGALTRETVMVFVAAIAIIRLAEIIRRRTRFGRADLAWLVPVAAFAGWQLIVYAVIGIIPFRTDAENNSGRPLTAMVDAVRHNFSHLSVHDWPLNVWVVEFIVLAIFVVLALASLGSTEAPPWERLSLILFIVELAVLSPGIWNGVVDLRSLDEVYLFAVLVMLSAPRRRLRLPATALAPALLAVTVHRIGAL